MYVKHALFKNLSLVMTEDGNEDTTTIISSTDPDPSSIPTDITTFSTTLSSGTTEVTSPGGDSESEEDEKKWVLPLVISLGCLLLVAGGAAIVIIYRKWKCFGLPLPFTRGNVPLAQPLKKITNSVRSSISSSFSSSAGTLLEGGKNGSKHSRNYAVKVNRKLEGGDGNNKVDASERGLHWIEGKDFSGEFEALKRADLKDIPVTAALKPENVMRNRFSNVLPFDRTRVVLTTAERALGNDYVNASYVSGYQKDKEFICTQGPLKHTVTDFWRMCWETRAVAIVMLTKCYEKNQEKCFPYWPSGNTGNSVFGDVKVTLEKKTTWRLQAGGGEGEKDNSGELSPKDHLWQVSELTMEKEGETGTHSIIHIAFLSWPDFGIVDPPESLISFVRHVKQLVHNMEVYSNDILGKKKSRGPIVVHCSAGVGRSGVFIAVDHLIQQLMVLKKEDDDRTASGTISVNIFQTVLKMRRERMGMVQNLQQYTLIYKCLRILGSRDGRSKVDDEPSIVGNEKIQGSDWGGLPHPEAKTS